MSINILTILGSIIETSKNNNYIQPYGVQFLTNDKEKAIESLENLFNKIEISFYTFKDNEEELLKKIHTKEAKVVFLNKDNIEDKLYNKLIEDIFVIGIINNKYVSNIKKTLFIFVNEDFEREKIPNTKIIDFDQLDR